MKPHDWPSLLPQVGIAERLLGPPGAARLQDWLEVQVDRINDPGFARLFADHIDLPGIVQADYGHRLIRTGAGDLLGGIRFYGRDLERPFVDVIAHSFAGWAALRDCVAAEWAAFAPLHLRTLVPPGAALPADASVDMTVFAARRADMTRPDNRIVLVPFEDVEQAIEMVATRYEALRRDAPALARNLSAARPDDLRRWHAEGALRAIAVGGDGGVQTVGLLAAAPGCVEWIEGDEILEEVVATPFSGQGIAAAAQAAWAARPDGDPARLLIGTINADNIASRKSARRAGRTAVLDYVFMPLPQGRSRTF